MKGYELPTPARIYFIWSSNTHRDRIIRRYTVYS
jgi:hypothetical protein